MRARVCVQLVGAGRRLGYLWLFEEPPVSQIIEAKEQWRYRNKLEYSFGSDEDSGELVLGFHRPGRWNDIDDVSYDILASEAINGVRERVKAWCR